LNDLFFKLDVQEKLKFLGKCNLCGAKGMENCEGVERKNNTYRFPVCFTKPFNYHQQRKIKEVK
jgi:hypothetical protein|tara:strand:+ start:7164 stop:7355 length:192 start_codon:yes stop_codon:yes gene_type:complete